MNPLEQDNDLKPHDEEVEILLRQFFRQEIPVDLARIPMESDTPRVHSVVAYNAAVCAALLLFSIGCCFWLFIDHLNVVDEGGQSPSFQTTESPLYTVTEREAGVSVKDPVRLIWRKLAASEHTSGDHFELELPEITIELAESTVNIHALIDEDPPNQKE